MFFHKKQLEIKKKELQAFKLMENYKVLNLYL